MHWAITVPVDPLVISAEHCQTGIGRVSVVQDGNNSNDLFSLANLTAGRYGQRPATVRLGRSSRRILVCDIPRV
jgi:hypothetical protein